MHNATMIDWNDLSYFLAVARNGSTAAAARTLGVNQSTVTRRIAVLEEGLAVRLFDKHRSGYRLTRAGTDLLPHAIKVEEAVLGLCRQATSLERDLTGSLRLTTAEGVAYGLISPLLNAFHERFPGLRVNLLIEDRYVDLSHGEADVALRAGRTIKGDLIGRKLVDGAWAAYAIQDYVDRHGCPGTAQDLNAHRLVGFEGDLERIDAAQWLHATAPSGEIACRSNSILGHLMAAKSGVGIALLPCHIGDPEGDLVRVLPPIREILGEFWLLTHPDLHRTPKVRAFFDFMTSEIKKYRPLLLGETRRPAPAA